MDWSDTHQNVVQPSSIRKQGFLLWFSLNSNLDLKNILETARAVFTIPEFSLSWVGSSVPQITFEEDFVRRGMSLQLRNLGLLTKDMTASVSYWENPQSGVKFVLMGPWLKKKQRYFIQHYNLEESEHLEMRYLYSRPRGLRHVGTAKECGDGSIPPWGIFGQCVSSLPTQHDEELLY